MQTDWLKVSEILFAGLSQGAVAGVTVIIAYLLGKRQANVNWSRELGQREKEHSEQMQLLEEQLRLYEKQFTAEERERMQKNRPGLVNWNIKP